MNNTVTLRRTIEQQQREQEKQNATESNVNSTYIKEQERQQDKSQVKQHDKQQVKQQDKQQNKQQDKQQNKQQDKSQVKQQNKQQVKQNATESNGNSTYIKEEKKSKEKICDVLYLKTIDNLLNTIQTELEFGKINSKYLDDRHYIQVFAENVNTISKHMRSKLKSNAGLKLLRFFRSRLEIRKARELVNELRRQRNAAIVIQKNWRRFRVENKYGKLIKENSSKRSAAARIIQRSYRLHLARRQQLVQQVKERERIELLAHQSATIIQRCWRRNRFVCRLNNQIELRRDRLVKQRSAALIQRNWKLYQLKKTLTSLIEKRREELVRDRSARLVQKCWRNRQFKKRLGQLIEQRKQAELQRSELENRSASVIQRMWRVYLLKKNLTRLARLVKCRRNAINLIENECARLIQRKWKDHQLRKTIGQLIKKRKDEQQFELENRSASVIQKAWRIYRLKTNLNRLVEKRRLKNDACLRIQRAWRLYRMNKQHRLALENSSALVIQSSWRLYQAKKRLSQLRHERENKAALIIQKSWSSFAFRRNLANQMKLNEIRRTNLAASIIQRAWKSYLNRKQRFEEQRMRMAATQIQKTWRGYMCRLKCKRDIKDVSSIIERISEVNKNAITQTTVGEKTALAIQKLLTYKYHGTALHFLQELEKTTNLSDESCIQMADQMIIEVLLKVVFECNRSEPCLQIIKLVYSVILNIAKNDKALPLLCSMTSLKESIIETLNKHHKKTGIFLKAMTLLYILLKHEDVSVYLIQRILRFTNHFFVFV